MKSLYLSLACLLFITCQNQSKTQVDIKVLSNLLNKANTFGQGSEIALIYYDSIIALNPKYDKSWFEKGVWSLKTGDYINYKKYVDKAVELNKNNIGYRGWTKLLFLRDYQGAIDDFKILLSYHPDKKDVVAWGESVLFHLGKAYWQMKEYETAISYFDQYIAEESETSGEEWVDVKAFLYKGICLQKLGKHQEALASFEKGIHYYKTSPESYYHAGNSLVALKQKQKACTYFTKAEQYAKQGYIQKDAYQEVFGQLYFSDINKAIGQNCR